MMHGVRQWDDAELQRLNRKLKTLAPRDVIAEALAFGERPFATTSFGPHAAVLLHMLADVAPGLPIVWIDTGYNVNETYRTAEQLIDALQLNIHVYSPTMTAERRNALYGGIPTIEEADRHAEFSRQVKLEPFSRALRDLQPDVWLTGIRAEETEHRRQLGLLSLDARGLIKIAPLFHWSQGDLDRYIQRHQLPVGRHYFDPTKVHAGRECGLHTAA